jgi:ATP-binding cassette subfamily B protein
VIVLLQAAATVAMLYLPSLNADIIDQGIARADNRRTLQLGGVMVLLTLAQGICQVATAYFAGHVAMGCGRDLRRALLERIGGFSQREIARFSPSSLTVRSTNDVQQVQMLMLLICTMAALVPLMLAGGTVMAFRQDPGMAWLIAATVAALAVGLGLVVSRLIPAFRAVQVHLDTVNRILREQITGIRVIRAFVREQVEATRFAAANRDLTDVAVTAGRWMSAMFPLVLGVANVAAVGVIWFGGRRVENGSIEVGAVAAFIAYLLLILIAVMMGSFLVMMLPRAAVSADRIIEVLDTRSTVVRPTDPVRDVDHSGYVDIECVDVSHPGAERPVISQVTLAARPGQTVAIIGSTGAGKSTLISLVPRLLDASAGVVRVDGIDVRRLDPEDLWRRMALVPQRAFLFGATIADNLRYGNADASDAELWDALETAQARDFVAALPEGLATSSSTPARRSGRCRWKAG